MDRDCPKSDETISEFGILFLRIMVVSAESTFQEGTEENGAQLKAFRPVLRNRKLVN